MYYHTFLLVIERHGHIIFTVFSYKCDVMENIHPDETKYTLHLEKSVKKKCVA